ncbi:transcriptional regulator with XRE-family HTH domain [Bradyrhizobium sp. AZCC 1719]
MSQEELAHAAELSQDQISEIENAKHSTTLDNIQRLALRANGLLMGTVIADAMNRKPIEHSDEVFAVI